MIAVILFSKKQYGGSNVMSNHCVKQSDRCPSKRYGPRYNAGEEDPSQGYQRAPAIRIVSSDIMNGTRTLTSEFFKSFSPVGDLRKF